MTKHDIAARAERIVSIEVTACLSGLVYTLSKGYGRTYDSSSLGDLMEQAAMLRTPLPDFESAAREAGWRHHDNSWRGFYNEQTQEVSPSFMDPTTPEGCVEALCRHYDIEPHDREVYEHWAVSDWLADKLEAHGEKVDRDFAELTVWARTTTGQGIYADAVIEAIAAEIEGDTTGAEG